MAGLSSVMAITRPLGEVNLAAMNRCAGIYRVYLNGGGGGGGGFDDFYLWYGGSGSYASESSYNVSLVPPITLSAGSGGSAGDGADTAGGQGGQTSMNDSRETIMPASGGAGGTSATTERSLEPVTAPTRLATVSGRFTVAISNSIPSTPYFSVTTGRGGGSLTAGSAGGIIKAFRIG